MSGATWEVKRYIVRAKYPVIMPERVRTRHGNILLRVPDVLGINGNLYLSKRLMNRINQHMARSTQRRIDEMARVALLGAFTPRTAPAADAQGVA